MFKLTILLFFLTFSTNSVLSQFANCFFTDTEYQGYACELEISNLKSLPNYTQITGNHPDVRSDADVQTIINLVKINATTFPFELICEKFVNIERIEFDSSFISYVEEDAFDKCGHLNNITFRAGNISEFYENVFNKHLNMKFLAFSGNLLMTLPEKIFANLTQMNYLYMDNNELEELPEGIFDYFVNLDELIMFSNHLSDLSDNIFKNMIMLTRLDLSDNLLSVLKPKWFETLTNMNYLLLSDNKFREIPADLFLPMPKIYDIYIDSNRIMELPKNIFSPLKNLFMLVINNNKLKRIHSDSFDNPELFEFYFNDNHIVAIDEWLLNITALTKIDGTNNACIVGDGYVRDTSDAKSTIKATLKTCFENNSARDSICEAEDIEEKVCQMEKDTVVMKNQFGVITDGNVGIREEIEELQVDAQDIRNKTNELKTGNSEMRVGFNEFVQENQVASESFSSKLRVLQEQIVELRESLPNSGTKITFNMLILIISVMTLNNYFN